MGFTFLLKKSLEDEKGIPKKNKKKVNYVPDDDDEKKVLFQKGTEECETILIFSELHK
jgi:hypothetical protein